jgi:hypothetical protein
MATKKAQPVAEAVPVSAEENIEVTIFSQPQGEMLGTIIAFDTVKGKWTRRAHCYLYTHGPEMTMEKVNGKLTYVDIERLISIQALFVEKVKEFYANR